LSAHDRLIPGAKECLSFMKAHAKIGILTNGFELTQKIKLAESGFGSMDRLRTKLGSLWQCQTFKRVL
jgi:Predicted hydrolase (HAD superfamily)